MKRLAITMAIFIFAMTTTFAQSREERKEDRQEKVEDLKKDVKKETKKAKKSVKQNWKKAEKKIKKTSKKAKKELGNSWDELTAETEILIENFDKKAQKAKADTEKSEKPAPAKTTNRKLKQT
jgi:F0F1-type ATP synthase membrane subunit b/b'